jgi:hypothetical protein
MSRTITPATSLENLRREAKRWLRALRDGDIAARSRFEQVRPGGPAHPVLRDVQQALALEYGHESWTALTRALAPPDYDRLAHDFVQAFARDEAALARLNAHYRRAFGFDDLWADIWRRVYSFRQRAFREPSQALRLDEAQTLVAQDAGYGSWDALMRAGAGGDPPIPAHAIEDRTIAPRRQLRPSEWDDLIAAIEERDLTSIVAGGLMTDEVLARIARLERVTKLGLGGSRQLSDQGLQHLARMPQLQELNLSEYPGGKLTDRGLEVLRHLPNLRWFEMTWQKGITDAGVANLRFCEQIEHVDLMGTFTGDGAIEALQGKPKLHYVSTGRQVTDAGLRLLQHFPLLKARDAAHDAHLLIDGPFTDEGLASLCGLDGIVDLDLFWHVTAVTADGFAHLVHLPSLETLGADAKLTDDATMPHLAALPRLRNLRAQGTAATDAGFEALSRSATLEKLWTGKDTIGLGNRGFAALSTMPALRNLGTSCRNVDDAALAALPRFAALRELTPIDVRDDGFRHIGRCERLERLVCMYCRDTTDLATEHVAGLQLRSYYAGLTQITDRSLAILGAMPSLEEIEFYECRGITDAGLGQLAALPQLRRVELSGLPGVTLAGTQVFPARVRVTYTT